MNIKEVNSADLQALQLSNKQEVELAIRQATRWGWWLPLLFWLIFSVLYALSAFWHLNAIDLEAKNLAPDLVASFGQRHWYVGLVLGLASTLSAYVLYGLAWLLRLWRIRSWRIILATGAYVPWLWLGWRLTYGQSSEQPLLQALSVYSAQPLLSASGLIVGLGLVWLLGRFLSAKHNARGVKISG